MLSKRFFIKSVHKAIFFFIAACLAYILYAGIMRTYNWYLAIAIVAVLIEGLVLLFNHWRCPLTSLSQKYGDEKGSVTDIFLPAWCARNVFRFCLVLFITELILVGFGYFMQ